HPDAHKEGGDAEYPGEAPSLHDRLARLEGRVPESELASLRTDLERLEARGIPASELAAVRADLDALEAKFGDTEAR
ncbi:MAG TPA: hypothetical protein VH701_13840, partial [Vicinamibacterales bacterium]